jgi:hypothetical protein
MTRLLLVIAIVFALVLTPFFVFAAVATDGAGVEVTALKRWTGCPPYC